MRRPFQTQSASWQSTTPLLLIAILGSALPLTASGGAYAQSKARIEAADPNLQGDGTMSPAARAALTRGPLPMSPAHVERKRAADQESEAAEAAGRMRRSGASPAEAGGEAAAAQAPAVVGSLSFAGQSNPNLSPSDSTGSIGPTRYIQTVNSSARIYNRSTGATIATGTLNQLAGLSSSVFTFDPQIMWDPTTSRFYYVMDAVFSSTSNKLAYGFSKTATPGSISSADWCHYTISYKSRFPDFPKLGDSRWFSIIGVNTFNSSDVFLGSDILAVSKPPSGTGCPSFSTFKFDSQTNIKDTSNQQTFTPVPANQVDTNNTGYVVALNGTLPSTSLWFYTVMRDATTGMPVFGPPQGLNVPSYDIPPAAMQPGKIKIDTSDARVTQAVQAVNPDRSGMQSFWMQHTVKHPTDPRSIVRWYEVNPAATPPVLLRSSTIGAGSAHAGTFFYNAAISPDRRKDGKTARFGDSFVITYNVSSRANNISPGIFAASSVSGAGVRFKSIKKGVGPYRDFTCTTSSEVCRWGDYSSAMPDPRPTTTGIGEVWITNQYSGVTSPSTGQANWRTWIAATKP